MSEAKELHDDLMRALLSIVPRTTYQNIHRLSRLSWAIIGLCLTHTVRLGAWAELLESRATSAASRVRRFSKHGCVNQPSTHNSGMHLFSKLPWTIGHPTPLSMWPWIPPPSLPLYSSVPHSSTEVVLSRWPGEPCATEVPRSLLRTISPCLSRCAPSCHLIW
jgi:hypothetical protein